MPSVRIALDFDGSVATWHSGHNVDFDDLEASMLHALAYPAVIHWMRIRMRAGDEFIILTGRGEAHCPYIKRWFRCILGSQVPVYGRPKSIGLSSPHQASWKAAMLKALQPALYVGDNVLIDEEAAKISRTPYVDVREIQAGAMPRPAPRPYKP
jgi:hypothetical protein